MVTLTAILASIPSYGILAASHGSSPITTISLGTGATVVVTVMAWIVRKVVAGEVVPVPIAELLEAQKKQAEDTKKILDRLLEDRQEQRNMVRAGTEANFAVYEFLRSNGWSAAAHRPGTSAHAEKVS